MRHQLEDFSQLLATRVRLGMRFLCASPRIYMQGYENIKVSMRFAPRSGACMQMKGPPKPTD